MGTETAEKIKYAAAAATTKGRRLGNGVAIAICESLNGTSPFSGFYCIADSAASSADPEEAAHIAAAALRRFIDTKLPSFTDPVAAVAAAISDATAAIGKANTKRPGTPLSASFICCCVEQSAAHISFSGDSAAYMLNTSHIARITPRSSDPGNVHPSVFTHDVSRDDIILLCTGSVSSRVDNLRMRDLIEHESDLNEGIANILQAARDKDDSADLGAIAISSEKRIPSPPPLRPDNHRNKLVTRKLLSVSALTVISATLFSLPALLGQKQPGTRNTAMTEYAALPPSQNLSTRFVITTFPTDSTLTINGQVLAGRSPFNFEVPSGRRTTIEVSADGYLPHREVFANPSIDKITRDIALAEIQQKNHPTAAGSISIHCIPSCDGIEIDGRNISKSGATVSIASLKPGTHPIAAWHRDVQIAKSVTVRDADTTAVTFNFSGIRQDRRKETSEEHSLQPQRPAPISESPAVTTTRTSPTPFPVRTTPVRQPENTQSMLLVRCDAQDCNIMLFHNGNLALAGFSGTKYFVKPGTYELHVTKPGYDDYVTTIEIDSETSEIPVRLQRATTARASDRPEY